MNLKKKTIFINSLLHDLKAEYLVASLLDEGAPAGDIFVAFEGTLKRKWSADIRYAELESFENGDEVLGIRLNRAGIYDALPEALFHDYPDKRNATGEEMARDSMRLKAEEKQIRSFFRPFEHEFFLQKVRIAMKESGELQSFHFEFLDELFPDFWKIDKKIPALYVSKLIKLLPFVHRIVGNYELTARCLSEILNEKVSIGITGRNHECPEENNIDEGVNGFKLGRINLGKDTVLGNQPTGFIGKLLVRIGPVDGNKIKAYFKDGPADRLLRCFYGYFLPLELDVETRLLPEKTRSRLKLPADFETGDSYLGYNTVL
jgi:hypothetical protein